MYAWIWRHLPFGRPGKIIGSLLLIAAVVAVLWFKVFALVDPLLPNNDGQITEGSSSSSDGVVPTPTPGASAAEGGGDPGVLGPGTMVSATAVSSRPRSTQPRSPQPRSPQPRSSQNRTPQPSR